MKFSHIVAAAAVAFCASQAGAQSISVAPAVSPFGYIALDGLTGSFSVGTTAIPNVQAVPLGASSFDVVTLGQTATLTFGAGVTSYTFLWGSPDLENKLVVDGTVTFTGANVVASGYGLDSSSRLVTITDLTGLSSLSFTTTKIAFEVARVNPVPEPETYALMLAGLGAIGFVARRRKAA